ncbi:MAG: hypothetical protein WCG21_10820 [Eubacteriales bacterium]
MKTKITADEAWYYGQSELGRAYLEYNKKVGGEPFGYSLGAPDVDKLYGGIIGLYQECIKQGIPWEKLIGSGFDEIQD